MSDARVETGHSCGEEGDDGPTQQVLPSPIPSAAKSCTADDTNDACAMFRSSCHAYDPANRYLRTRLPASRIDIDEFIRENRLDLASMRRSIADARHITERTRDLIAESIQCLKQMPADTAGLRGHGTTEES